MRTKERAWNPGSVDLPFEVRSRFGVKHTSRSSEIRRPVLAIAGNFQRSEPAVDITVGHVMRVAYETEEDMNLPIDPVLASRIKTAWAKLPHDQQERLKPLLMEAHQRALAVSQGQQPVTPAEAQIAPSAGLRLGHILPLAFTALEGDTDKVLNTLAPGVVISVDPKGEIWGTGKYEQLDPGWLEAAAEWLENLAPGSPHPAFNTNPVVFNMPDDVQIGLAGDWGTGDWRGGPQSANPAPGTDVCSRINVLQPHLTIHLGDVYYAGTDDQELHILTKGWPPGSIGSLSLNSNHEMYSGGGPYFNAIANAPFVIQRGCSYFALENKNWVIVGLDSAYYSDAEGLYEDGVIFRTGGPMDQLEFLKSQVAKGKKIILLTHHNAVAQDGSSKSTLWNQVMSAFPADAGPAYWYWGHAHCGAFYQNLTNGNATVLCRCCGHSGLPCGQASIMANKPNVLWYEGHDRTRLAHDPDIPIRILNGFAMLYLQRDQIDEVFYDEKGGIAWSSTARAARAAR